MLPVKKKCTYIDGNYTSKSPGKLLLICLFKVRRMTQLLVTKQRSNMEAIRLLVTIGNYIQLLTALIFSFPSGNSNVKHILWVTLKICL